MSLDAPNKPTMKNIRIIIAEQNLGNVEQFWLQK